MAIWYAVELKPGAWLPNRTFRREKSARNEGETRLVIERGSMPAILRSMKEGGFDCYLPMDVAVKPHRRTKKLVERRMPLVPGYAFVRDVSDFMSLSRVGGVLRIVTSGNKPVTIPQMSIATLMDAEAAIAENAARRLKMAERAGKRKTRKQVAEIYPEGSTVRFHSELLGTREAIVKETTGRQTVKAMLEFLGSMIPVEVNISDIEPAIDEKLKIT